MKKLNIRTIMLIWVLGMAGQICWNIENMWFNTFVYENIAPKPTIVSCMVAVSAIATTFSTFFFGTLSDRLGKRKPFICLGYVFWGLFTIVFGLTMYVPGSTESMLVFVATLVVLADAIMSFFGSMGNDSGFNAWIADNLNESNKGVIGGTLAAQPVLGTIIGTIVGGAIIQGFGYLIFFLIMGGLVIIIGLIAYFYMRDVPNIQIKKEGTFWQQFAKSFDFRDYFKKKELVLVNLITTVYFISFNVYFVYIGNLFIYNYNFQEFDAGLLQGIGLVIAILFTIPAGKLINKNKSPLAIFLAIVIDVIGLLLLFIIGNKVDVTNVFSVKNIPLLIGIILVGVGYVVTLQTITVWGKSLYPENQRGRFEGIRLLFFVLIPMVVGPLIANPIINSYGKEVSIKYNSVYIDGMAPTESLFLAAAIVVVFTLIPLYFANKHYKDRIKNEKRNNAENTDI